MNKKPIVALGTLLILMLSACHAPADHPGTRVDTMNLKIYSVPTAQTDTLAGALQNALGKKANVTVSGPGKLLIYAPEGTQMSISDAIASLSQPASIEQAPTPLNVHFWIVDGYPTQQIDDPMLKPLEPTLNVLRKSMGPMHFRLIQTASSMSSSTRQSSLIKTNQGIFQFQLEGTSPQSATMHLSYHAQTSVEQFSSSAVSGPFESSVIPLSGLQELQTQIEAPLGQYIVLAQAPGVCSVPIKTVIANGHANTIACSDKPSLRLLITRVDHVSPSA